MADVFVSYSRKDGAFVRELHEFLTAAGRDVWVDWEDIPAAAEWEQDIYTNIDSAESFVFVVSTRSLASEVCGQELAHAQKGGKRIVPIACDAADPAMAQQGLRQLNWIWCRETDDRDAAFAKLTGALDTDLEWARAHTRLLVRAVEWESQQDKSLLLRGRDLGRAEQLLTANAAKEPRPTELQQRYVRASRTAASKLQRLVIGATLLALAVSIVLGVVALVERNTARNQRDNATSVALASAADQQPANTVEIALLLAHEAYRASATVQARNSMIKALEEARRMGAREIFRTAQTRAFGVAFSPDGSTLASAGGDGTVRLWDVRSHKSVGGPLNGNQGRVRAVAFAPDGKTLASAGEDGTVLLRDTSDAGAPGDPAIRHQGTAFGAVFSPDGKRVASVGADGLVRVWERDAPGVRAVGQTGPGKARALYGIAISKDGRLLATAGEDGRVLLWDIEGGGAGLAGPRPRPLLGHEGPVHDVAFSPDGRTLASGGEDGTLRLWDVVRGKELGEPLEASGPDATGAHHVFSVAFSPDGKTLATAASDGTVRLWDPLAPARPGRVLEGRQGPVYGVAFSSDGHTLASAGEDGTVVIWDTEKLDQPSLPGSEPIRGLSFSPDGRTLAVAGADGAVQLWDALTRTTRGAPIDGHAGPVLGAAFSSDGKTLATAGSDGTVRLWDTSLSGAAGPVLRGEHGRVRGVAFSPDGRTLASADGDGTVALWDTTAPAAPPRPLAGSQRVVYAVAFSPDGKTIASAGADGTVLLRDPGRPDAPGVSLTGSDESASGDKAVFGVAFSSDGRTLASGGVDGTVRFWNAHDPTGAVWVVRANQDHVRAVTFSPDGSILASVGDAGTVRLWDALAHTRLGETLVAANGRALVVAFDPDGRTLATSGDGGTVRLRDGIVWRDAADLTAQVCSLVVGNLTEDEWYTLVPGLAYRASCPA